MSEESVCTRIDSVHPGKGVRIIFDCWQVLVTKKKSTMSTMHTHVSVSVCSRKSTL